MITETYIQLRLTGRRFDEHVIPFGFLKCIASLEEMADALARSQYLEDNPERNIPRGFMTGVGLSLARLEVGSAVAEVQITTTDQASEEAAHYFNRGCKILTGILEMGEYDSLNLPELPSKVASGFRRIGRGLQSDDALEITGESLRSTVRLSRTSKVFQNPQGFGGTVRQSMNLYPLSLSGQVATVDKLTMRFTMRLPDGQTADAPIQSDYARHVLQALDEYHSGTLLHVEGAGRTRLRKPQFTFTRIDDVEIVNPVIGDSTRADIQERLSISSQLDELRSLENGWLDGEGKAPSEEGLNWLAQSLDRYYPADLPRPYLFPTEQGGVQAEWIFGAVNIEVRIDLFTKQATFLWIDADTESEDDLDLTDESGWNRLSAIIREG